MKLSDREFLYIIGSPRSGTTWLQIMLGAHPRVVTTVELTLFYNYTKPWIQSWNWEMQRREETGVHQGLPCIWTEDEFNGFLKEFLAQAYDHVVALNPEATHVLDKSCEYAFQVEDISRLLPNPRFIHMIRDGRDVATSMMAARKTIGAWGGTIEKAARLWRDHVNASFKARENPDRYHEVRYEELKSRGPEILKSVYDFCGLPTTEEEVVKIYEAHEFSKMKQKRQESDQRYARPEDHYRKGQSGTWQSELSPNQRYIFDRIAGPLLQELGYADGSAWVGTGYRRFASRILFSLGRVRKRVARATSEMLGPRLMGHINTKLNKNLG